MWIQPNIYKKKSAACGSGMNTMYSHNINSFAKWAPSHLVDTRAVYSSVHKAALLSIVSFSRYVCTAAKTRSPLNARVEEKALLTLDLDSVLDKYAPYILYLSYQLMSSDDDCSYVVFGCAWWWCSVNSALCH